MDWGVGGRDGGKFARGEEEANGGRGLCGEEGRTGGKEEGRGRKLVAEGTKDNKDNDAA